MEDLITVVVPVYNVEKYLKKCIDSIINQTYKNIEIILVDDGSPDNCGKICDEYAKNDQRIKVIHKENGGLSDARNAGIDVATGEYITFVDSDDYIEENCIEFLYDDIIKDNTDMAIGLHIVRYDDGTVIRKRTKKTILEPKETLKRILYDQGIDLSAWAKLYNIKLFKKVRYPKGRIFEDAATTYKLIDECNKISIDDNVVYNYIIRNDSITNEEFSKNKLQLIDSTKEMTDYIKLKYPDLEKACKRRLMYAYLSTITQLCKADKDYPEIRKMLMKYIEENKKDILRDSNIPKRDRYALILLSFGFSFYKLIWRLYDRIRRTK